MRHQLAVVFVYIQRAHVLPAESLHRRHHDNGVTVEQRTLHPSGFFDVQDGDVAEVGVQRLSIRIGIVLKA